MTGTRVTTRLRSLFGLIACLAIMVVYGAATMNPAGAVSPVGAGSAEASQFVDAYYRTAPDGSSGFARYGFASNDVHQWTAWGCNQDFDRADGYHTSMLQAGCHGTVRPVSGQIWARYYNALTADAPSVYGYPTTDAYVWGNGLVQDFDGGSYHWTKMMQAGGGNNPVFNIRGDFLLYYMDHGGPTGTLGYPVSDEYSIDDVNHVEKQDFQGGSLVWDVVNRVRPYVPPPPPAPAMPVRIQHALDKAGYELHSPDPTWSNELNAPWSGMCEAFVEISYGERGPKGGQYGSAIDDYHAQLYAGRVHSDIDAPPGALVYYGGGGGNGHVGISVGGRMVISTWGYINQRLPVKLFYITSISNPYYGWAYPPDNWPGR